MSFTTYGGLKTALDAAHARADIAARYDDLITRAEARLNRTLALQAAGEIASTAITISTEATDLPADFNGMRQLSLELASRTAPIEYYPPERLYLEFGATTLGLPRAYTLLGKDGVSDVVQVNVRPLPDATYTARAIYYKKIATLVGGDSRTNWMLVNNPDAYMYATLIELGLEISDGDMAQSYSTALAAAMQDIKGLDRMRRWGGSLRVRSNTVLLKGN